jgi:two-component system chemotaxis response regulator CheB
VGTGVSVEWFYRSDLSGKGDLVIRDVVAIGTSAGGVEALLYLVKHLPKAFPASILITIHLPSYGRSALDDILTRAGPLSAQFANDGDVLRKGRIYIAPQDRHLLLDGAITSRWA